MGNWRVLLVVAVGIALLCWAGIIALHQADENNGISSSVQLGATNPNLCGESFAQGSVVPRWLNFKTQTIYQTQDECLKSTAHRTVTSHLRGLSLSQRAPAWLAWLGISAVVLTLASIPYLSERSRRLKGSENPAR